MPRKTPRLTTDKNILFTYPAARKGAYTIPNGTTAIRKYAFHTTPGLTEVSIPEGVTDIGLFAFMRCPALSTVSLPLTLSTLESSFDNTVRNINYAGGAADWEKIAPLVTIRDFADIHLNTPAPVAAPAFSDVSSADYFVAPVAWAVGNNITQGMGNGQFRPNQNCTNAQILTFLWRACGKPEPSIECPFTNEIPEGYRQAAIWAYEKGMISGPAFDADAPCSRAMAVMYMWQAAGSPLPEQTSSFTDVPADAPFAAAVSWAVANSITTGTGTGSFSPEAVCTRGEIATFLYRDLA